MIEISRIYGGNGGGPFVWEANYASNGTASDVRCSLLGFLGGSGSGLDRLCPIWAPDPPQKFNLAIDNFDERQLSGNTKVEDVNSTEDTTENSNLESAVSSTLTWTVELSLSSTISLSESSRLLLGGKVGLEVSATGEGKIPFLGKAEITTKMSMESSVEKEWGRTTTDSTEKRVTFTKSLQNTVSVPPNTRVIGTATIIRRSCRNVGWTGVMTVTYASGATKSFPVNGTLDSVNATTYKTSYRSESLK